MLQILSRRVSIETEWTIGPKPLTCGQKSWRFDGDGCAFSDISVEKLIPIGIFCFPAVTADERGNLAPLPSVKIRCTSLRRTEAIQI